MTVQKGKQGTKGQKQIMEENSETLKFYRNMVFGANATYFLIMCVFFEIFSAFYIFILLLSTTCYVGSYQFMVYMARVKLTETGQVLDPGVDLNMNGGIAEHVKDIIILTAGSQLLSLISNYFWLLLLLAPIRGFYFLWVNILSPYFFQEGAQQEVDEKKQRKLEKKMRRH